MKKYFTIMLLILVTIWLPTVYNIPQEHSLRKRLKRADDMDPSRSPEDDIMGNIKKNLGGRKSTGDEIPCDRSKIRHLTSIVNPKHHASSIAMKAALEAKKANDEMSMAVKTALHKIKHEYADRAQSAAKTAEAALLPKQQLLEQLQSEVLEAQSVVQDEAQALTVSESNHQLAQTAVFQAKSELKLIKQAIKIAEENLGTAEQVASVSRQSLSEKISLLDAAKSRVELLMRQVAEARTDLASTKKAAYRAACSAHEAKERIDRQRRTTPDIFS